MNSDSNRWQEIRASQTNRMGLLRGLTHATTLSVTSVLATLSALARGSEPIPSKVTGDNAWDGSEAFLGLEDEVSAFQTAPRDTDRFEAPRAPAQHAPTFPSTDPVFPGGDAGSPIHANGAASTFGSASEMAAAAAAVLSQQDKGTAPRAAPRNGRDPLEAATFRTKRSNGELKSPIVPHNGKLS